MIDIKEVSFSYNKEESVLKSLSTGFSEGCVTSIMGRNGSGKSTLLKTINGLLKPSSGSVLIDSRDISGISGKELAKAIGFLSQRSEGIDATVMDAVLTGRRPHINFNICDYDRDIAKGVIKRMGLEELACRKTTELSGGELQKAVIARALVQEPKVLLLDEPVNHLDMVNQHDVLHLIREITIEKKLTTAIVMHDINSAIRYSDKLVFMKNGSVANVCEAEKVTTDIIRNTFDINAEIIVYMNKPFVVVV